MNESRGMERRGVWGVLVVVLLLAVPLAAAGSTQVTVAVANTTCAQLTITQIIFLQVILPVHFQIGSIQVPIGETKILEYDFEQTPTVLQLGGTRDGSSFQETVSVPGSATFGCGTITVTVGSAPTPPTGDGSTAELTRWTIPTANARPSGIGVGPEGRIYFAEHGADRIGQLDPGTHQVRERTATGGPFGLYVTSGGTLYYTLATANALEVMLFDGGTHRWSLPTTNAFPGDLVPAASGPGQVNLWLPERNTGRVARFSPNMVQIPMILITTPPTSVSPTASTISGSVTSVSPEVHPGNPMLPPPIAMLSPMSTTPFTDWQSPGPVMRVATAPDGRIWFTDTGSTLSVLDPASNTAYYYSLPSGTQALAVTVGPNGWVWFTDLGRPAIGVLDPASADVRLWPVPGGGQPFDLVRDGDGGLWFTDRTSNALGRLNPFLNEMTVYSLPGSPQPLFLALDEEERVWFTADQGNYVGRLSVAPVLGPPLLPPTTGAFPVTNLHVNLSGPVFGQWKTGQLTVSYSYDGNAGLPVWVRVEMLSGGSVVSGFTVTPVQVPSTGTGAVVVAVSYDGASAATTDGIRIIASQTAWGPAFSQVVYPAGPISWTP